MENNDQEIKQCSKCKQYRTLDNFKEGRKQCNVCLDAKWRYRQKYPEKISQHNKEYYQNNREEQLRKVKELKAITEYCFVCECNVRQYDVKRHLNTKKHNKKVEEMLNSK